MPEKLIKNPDTESAYQIIPAPSAPAVTLATNPFADRDAAQQAAAQPGNVTNGGINPDVAEFAAGKAVSHPAPAGTPEQPTTAVPRATAEGTATQSAETSSIFDGQTAKMNDVIDPATGKAKEDLTPKYRFQWGQPGVDLESLMKSQDPTSKRQIIDDYLKYMYDNNLPVDYYTLNDIVNKSHDLSLSPADDEKEKKRLANKERWDKFSNFLLHLGNAIGNVGGGGYASMKLEDPVQWTERQRMLKEKTEQQRRLNNQSIIQQMHKNYADERTYKLKQQQQDRLDKETKIRQEKNDAYIMAQKAAASKNEAQTAYWETKANALEQGLPLEEAIKRAKLAKTEAETRLANVKANNGGFAPQKPIQEKEEVVTKEDARGRKSTIRKVIRPAGNRGNGGNAFGDRGKGKSAFGGKK